METRQKKRTPSGSTHSPRDTGTAKRKKPSGASATGTTRRKSPSGSPSGAAPRRRSPSGETARRVKAAASQRTRTTGKRRKAAAPRPAPEVVYTPARPFNRNRLLLQLATVVAVVLALSLGISVFFKVETITVAGSEKYDPWTVKEASGIKIGDNLLSFGESKAAGKIKTALPYVDTVRIGIKLPDTVNIEIKEFDVLYALRDAADQWWLMTSEGKVVDRVDSATAGENTMILGVRLSNPLIGQMAVAQEEATPSADGTDTTMPPVTVKGSDRLEAALSIMRYLEECSVIGKVASVDVTDLGNLELWYGQRFQVKLGDTNQLLYKIKCMNAAINGDPATRLKDYDSGVLDISFTIKANQIIYQPFEE